MIATSVIRSVVLHTTLYRLEVAGIEDTDLKRRKTKELFAKGAKTDVSALLVDFVL